MSQLGHEEMKTLATKMEKRSGVAYGRNTFYQKLTAIWGGRGRQKTAARWCVELTEVYLL